jgi:hypothetical protein
MNEHSVDAAMRIFVPRDAAAKALGAEAVVHAILAEADARAARAA